MATKTASWKTYVATDQITWETLMAGTGWTGARIFRLRELAAELEGHDGGALPRDRFGVLTGTTERSLHRWEHNEGQPGLIYRRGMAGYAEKLNDHQRLRLLQI